MQVLPVPSPLRKSPPWIMNSLIYKQSISRHDSRCFVEVSTSRWILTYNAVELAPFVALRSALGILVLACAVLAEVFGGLGGGVGEELYFHAA